MRLIKSPGQAISRVSEKIDTLPAWLRPVVYGPFVLLGFVLYRGGIILVPLVALFLLFGDNRAAVMLAGIEVTVTLIVGSAAGGFLYGVAGRHARKLSGVGPLIAGMTALFPYILLISPVMWMTDDRPLLAPARHIWHWPGFEGFDYFWIPFATIVFGAAFGYGAFGDAKDDNPDRESAV